MRRPLEVETNLLAEIVFELIGWDIPRHRIDVDHLPQYWQHLILVVKREKRLEAVLAVRTPCQRLLVLVLAAAVALAALNDRNYQFDPVHTAKWRTRPPVLVIKSLHVIFGAVFAINVLVERCHGLLHNVLDGLNVTQNLALVLRELHVLFVVVAHQHPLGAVLCSHATLVVRLAPTVILQALDDVVVVQLREPLPAAVPLVLRAFPQPRLDLVLVEPHLEVDAVSLPRQTFT
mmetsp:Transcript_35513/g.95294  ORF Transcript_35513/g.95294 Transcript_35513/m.95294 type:complete len:233 (+) Transcript_35513:2301-2999(+)